ncbi:MAG: PHP-associated domain-containing protein [Halobacteriaceae archaeon]
MPTRVDPHVKVLDEAVVERAKARGLDVLVFAPHFERLPDIRARAERFSDDDLLVVPAREVFTGTLRHRKHVLALGLSDPIPDFITLDGAMDEIERQGAITLAPHPGFATVSLSPDELRRYDVAAAESYNPKQRAAGQTPAPTADRPVFGSSYAHLRTTVGEVWTEFEADVDSAAALVDAFREGAPRRVYHRRGPSHIARCAAEFAHLGWENTAEKIDRVLLSGMEATHPGHVAYGDRFADVAVY